jgi:hypothetical protein
MSDGQPRRSDIRLPPMVSYAAIGDVCFYYSASPSIHSDNIFRAGDSEGLAACGRPRSRGQEPRTTYGPYHYSCHHHHMPAGPGGINST